VLVLYDNDFKAGNELQSKEIFDFGRLVPAENFGKKKEPSPEVIRRGLVNLQAVQWRSL